MPFFQSPLQPLQAHRQHDLPTLLSLRAADVDLQAPGFNAADISANEAFLLRVHAEKLLESLGAAAWQHASFQYLTQLHPDIWHTGHVQLGDAWA